MERTLSHTQIHGKSGGLTQRSSQTVSTKKVVLKGRGIYSAHRITQVQSSKSTPKIGLSPRKSATKTLQTIPLSQYTNPKEQSIETVSINVTSFNTSGQQQPRPLTSKYSSTSKKQNSTVMVGEFRRQNIQPKQNNKQKPAHSIKVMHGDSAKDVMVQDVSSEDLVNILPLDSERTAAKTMVPEQMKMFDLALDTSEQSQKRQLVDLNPGQKTSLNAINQY